MITLKADEINKDAHGMIGIKGLSKKKTIVRKFQIKIGKYGGRWVEIMMSNRERELVNSKYGDRQGPPL